MSFGLYARASAIDVIFNLTVSNLQGLGSLFRFYIYGLFVIMLITIIVLIVKPRDTPAKDIKLKSVKK